VREVSFTSSIQAQLNSDFIFSIDEAPWVSLFLFKQVTSPFRIGLLGLRRRPALIPIVDTERGG